MRIPLLLLSGLICWIASADNVYVQAPSESVPEVSPATLVGLVRTSVGELGHRTVVSAGEAETVLKPSLVKLGTSYIVAIEKTAAGAGAGVATRLKAKNVEELDEVVARVVRAVLKEKTATSDARPSDVTREEQTRGSIRRESRKGRHIQGGAAFGSNLNTRGMGYYFGFGSGWGMGQFILGFGGDLAILPNRANPTGLFGDFRVDATYYFLDNDVSPFLGAEFGFGFVREGFDADWYGGAAIGASVGVGFYRTYDTSARVGLRGVVLAGTALADAPMLGTIFIGIGF